MANHIHVHIHRAPTRDRAPVARAVRSIGRDQHAPEDVSNLVAVLMEAIAARQGKTADADFKEEDHKRDAGGKFTAGGMNADQHKAAAKEHRDILNAGTNSEKSSPHHAKAAMHHESAAFALEDGATSQAEAHANHAVHHKAEAAKVDEAHAISAHERQSSPAQGEKPTKATASGAKAATHELLSSGHPFSVDELCKATGASKASVMTALSDLKNPKYAGKLGALEVVKRPDGMYHVQKKEGAGIAPKPGPDGQPMGKHLELAAAERRVAENPRTTTSGNSEVRHTPKPTIESLQQQILAASQAVPGNTAAAAAERMKVIGPLNRQIAALRAQDPSTLEGHLAQSKVGPDGSVTHNGASVGKIEKKIIPGFKQVNGAPQMTNKEAYKVTHASGADLGHADTLKDAHTRLMQHHMKQPGTSSGPSTGQRDPGAKFAGAASPTPALMEALHGAAKRWATPIPPEQVEAAAKYMHGKAGVDILKMSDAAGLSVGAAKHLNEARKEHFRSQGSGGPQSQAQRIDNYLKQKHIGPINRGK